ncbi:hypothetical protein LTR70_009286 [Exophiala xenobiotica]|uniref:Uncharacterized protein n=1 Tax=Lithohypha guttulata TaxID=1690604 RepID=A0ABR0JY63_9EURO|nr:hypothetical protein LTR24_009040 [Lithohypha guttulata]KAK5310688.1 hypothetical protein LTR70_009286 [Exophiala xenobiotica]
MSTWQDLPPELTLRTLQFVFAGKRVTFRRPNASHDPKLLSILTISKTFVGRDVVLGAMLETVDVVLYSVGELYKLGTYLSSHDKSALRYVAVTPNCEQYPAVGDLSLREIKGIFPGIKVIDLGDWHTPDAGIPILNVSQHSMLFPLSVQVAHDSTFFAFPTPMLDPAIATGATFNLEEEFQKGYLNIKEASRLMVTPWKRPSKRSDYRSGYWQLRDTNRDRHTWHKALLLHGQSLRVEIKLWKAINIYQDGLYVWRHSARFSTKDMCARLQLPGIEMVVPQVYPKWFTKTDTIQGG